MSFFRTNFPDETVPPKVHILEDRVIPFITKLHTELGFLGEQGVESAHARMNTIRFNIRGLRDDLAILKSPWSHTGSRQGQEPVGTIHPEVSM